ncbi:carbohydrate-binding module family 32 [Amniculicola lignicola CBS 123094]|uniref:Carbohydrate-binding module family 32 n=1 Tax=Amniculicola lignicola CBS 123094 TaxID=1392246 RepID=A0A6A5WBP4_9PLEO|nr:carbohydrate-binding module family 32 [Amniculicola lignicola CBS 123094]
MGFIKYLLLALSLQQAVSAATIPLDRTGWTATADSNQAGDEPGRAIDGNPNTIWHSDYDPLHPLPNSITIDMKNNYLVGAVSYQPRQDGNGNGRIGQHRVYLSLDGTNWGAPVAVGQYINDAKTKKTTFVSKPARYVRITALTEAQSAANQFTSIAEVNIFADVKFLSRTGWAVTADSTETTTGDSPAKAIDGQGNTIWHTKFTGTPAGLPHWFRIDHGSQVPVIGLSYLPRADSANGRIGRYTIQSSNDGNTWTQVASGTWADNGQEKFATFSATARYFRLNALSEAGNRGPWTSAAEINLIDRTPPTYTSPTPSKGQWMNTVDFPIIPVAAVMLPTGKVLIFSSYKVDDYLGTTGQTETVIWDPATQASTPRLVINTQHDMFCPGISLDFNGRAIITGGNTSPKTSIYNPATNVWSGGANMQIPRGYQSTTMVSDGRMFNIGGSWSGGTGGKNGEIYSPANNIWTRVTNALVSPMLTNDQDGVYRADNHAWLFAWKNRYVFQAGPSRAMNWYNSNGAGSTVGAGNRGSDGDAMNGNAVMYDALAGKILTVGGAPSYQNSVARKNAFVITLGAVNTNPGVAQTGSMAFARGFANSVILPDGTVFTAGGQVTVQPFTDTTASLIPELWNPATGVWTQMNPMAIPRTYHSVGLLLPDATVMVGGGGLCGGCATNHWDAEIFVPPYLLNTDGSRRARPVINTVGNQVRIGATLTITTNAAVARFSLVRFGSVTHTVNTDQRRIPLPMTGSGTSYTVTIPNDAGIALPGYWFLFAINSAGTPSIAKVVKVTL